MFFKWLEAKWIPVGPPPPPPPPPFHVREDSDLLYDSQMFVDEEVVIFNDNIMV